MQDSEVVEPTISHLTDLYQVGDMLTKFTPRERIIMMMPDSATNLTHSVIKIAGERLRAYAWKCLVGASIKPAKSKIQYNPCDYTIAIKKLALAHEQHDLSRLDSYTESVIGSISHEVNTSLKDSANERLG